MEIRWRLLLLVWFYVDAVRGVLKETKYKDYREISYEDLTAGDVIKFNFDFPTNFAPQWLFDETENQLLVGARNYLYQFQLPDLKLREIVPWIVPKSDVKKCVDRRGQSFEMCENYVKVLLKNEEKLFVCGTSALSPACMWREIHNISITVDRLRNTIDAANICPTHPPTNATFLMTNFGDIFAGTSITFNSKDYIIRGSTRKAKMTYVKSDYYNDNWLNKPQFVGSFETEHHVYVVFREDAVEYLNCGRTIYSRIGRVCKEDLGRRNPGDMPHWTTFVKARLICALPGDYPFYYDEIQGMTYLADKGHIYATFTTSRNGIPGSAICEFKLDAIKSALNGRFKHQRNSTSFWEPATEINNFADKCNSTVDPLVSEQYHLVANPVLSPTQRPLHHSHLETFTHITVDDENGVIYVATEQGLVKKLSIFRGYRENQTTCLQEIWRPLPSNEPLSIHLMRFIKVGSRRYVYLSTNTGILRIPAEHCDRYQSEHLCLDPHCAWSELHQRCESQNDNMYPNIQRNCPPLNPVVDGRWSSWSGWSDCRHDSGDGFCSCRSRTCDNPSPQNGGRSCLGPSTEVINCTVDGKMSEWSHWSACFWRGKNFIQERNRTCTNPAPAFKGRVCTEKEISETRDCDLEEVCPDWTYTEWSSCSAKCGGGFRMKTSSRPGCNTKFDACNTHSCRTQKSTKLTPWTSLSHEKQIRYEISCEVPSAGSPPSIVYHVKGKSCDNGTCAPPPQPPVTGEWGCWSNWSECSDTNSSHPESKRFRKRKCLAVSNHQLKGVKCEGEEIEWEICAAAVLSASGFPGLVDTSNPPGMSALSVVILCILAFCFGLLASGLLSRFYAAKQEEPKFISRAQYTSSKQNSYESVPVSFKTKASPKRTPSFSNRNSTLTRTATLTRTVPSDTPKIFARASEYYLDKEMEKFS